MAWLRATSVLLSLLPMCVPQLGPPPPPSVPECHIPYEDDGDLTIQCLWDPGDDPQIPTHYSLHWQSDHGSSYDGSVEGTNTSGVIHRKHFTSHSGLRVWVRAENQRGSAMSPTAAFNTADIMKPSTPNISRHCGNCEPHLEIYWKYECIDLSFRGCEVQYRVQGDQLWTDGGEEVQLSFTFLDPHPFTVYDFKLRCACGDPGALMSEWSSLYPVQSAEAAPVGALDVWSDSGITAKLSECALMWKELPRSLAQGQVLGYVVTVSYNNGTVVVVNESMAEPGGLMICEEERCRFTTSLQSASGVQVSAYNSQGITKPAPLPLPTPGPYFLEHFNLKMDRVSLNVSWDLQLIESLLEFVVQYKEMGIDWTTQGFDWIKVDKNQTSVTLTGDFKNYTAYNVSLFAILRNNSYLLSSKMVYSLQGIPPKVQKFNVQDISDSQVNVTWEHIPLSQRRGVILRYHLGLDNKTEYKVSKDQNSYTLSGLNSGQVYHAWIRAETEAGSGPIETISFSKHGYQAYLKPVLVIGMMMLLMTFLFCVILKTPNFLVPGWYGEKVPDPSNSRLFQQMKSQFNGSWAEFCAPLEPNPKISVLEVVEIQPRGKTSCLDGQIDADSERDREEDADRGDVREEDSVQTKGRGGFGGEDYSKMIDSDRESVGEMAESWSLPEDEFVSDYEKHFMPTALDSIT